MSKSITDSINWVQASIGYKNPAIGNNNEPALGAANMTKQVMLAPPFKFSWNRNSKTFQVQIYVQDYTVAISDFGYVEKATFQPAASITQVASTGGTATYTAANGFVKGALVTVTGLTHTTFNVTNAVITTASATQFQVALAGTQTVVSDTGIAASGTIKEFQKILNHTGLAPSSEVQQPTTLAVQVNDLAGNITFRILSLPNANYQVVVVYQKFAVPFNALSDFWAPLPDFIQHVYNLGFRAHLYEANGDPRAQQAKIAFAAAMLSYSEGLSETEMNLFLIQYLGSAAMDLAKKLSTQQGISGRGQ